MKSNFKFIEKNFSDLYIKITNLEKILLIDPSICITSCRTSMEIGLKYIAKCENMTNMQKDLYSLIRAKELDIPYEVRKYFDQVRIMGNKATHEGFSYTIEDGISVLKAIFIIMTYIYENYVPYDKQNPIPKFISSLYMENNTDKKIELSVFKNISSKETLEEMEKNNPIVNNIHEEIEHKKQFRVETITKEDKERLSIWTEDENLSEALEKKFDEWKIYLHPKQRKVVEKSYNGPVLVEGGPGTGKSLVGIYRALELSKTIYPAKEGKKILFLTYTKNLVNNLKKDIEKIYQMENVENNVIVKGIDSLLKEIGMEAGIIKNYSYGLDKDIKKVNIYKNIIGNRFLKYEYEEVILKRGIETLEDYKNINSSLERDALNKGILEVSWELLEKIKDRRKHKKNSIELSYLLRDLIKNKELEAEYDSIIIDETQDLSGIQVEVLSLLCKNERNGLFFLSDPYQRIYKLHSFEDEFKMNFKNRKERLKVNYRTTGQIKRFADEIFSTDKRFKENYILENLLLGKKVKKTKTNDFANKVREIINDIKQKGEYKPEEIGILAHSNNELKAIESMGKKSSIDMNILKSGASIMEDNINLATFAGCKGLEFRVVIVVEKEEYRIEEGPYKEFEKRLMDCQKYVAYTRGREKLEIIKVGKYDR